MDRVRISKACARYVLPYLPLANFSADFEFSCLFWVVWGRGWDKWVLWTQTSARPFLYAQWIFSP